MAQDERQAGAEVEVTREKIATDLPHLTDVMIDAALTVDWVSSFQGEFEGFEPEHDAIMREHIRTLWEVIAASMQKESSYS